MKTISLSQLKDVLPKVPAILDKWDFKVIALFKGWCGEITVDKVRQIWAERCGIDVEYVNLNNITGHFLDLMYELNLLNNPYRFADFIQSLQPSENWRYISINTPYLTKETVDYQLILLSRIDSAFSLTDGVDLEGFREWLEKQDFYIEKQKENKEVVLS